MKLIFIERRFQCSELLSYLGLPIIRADGEAEKLCAQLNQMNVRDCYSFFLYNSMF